MSTQDFNTAEPAVEVRHSPTRLSSILAVVAALLAVLTSGIVSVLALVFGFLGLAGVAAGLFTLESRRAVLIGSGIVFFGVLISGLQGNTPPFLVFSTIATIVAFDLSQNAFSVGSQMSEETRTKRGELVHAAGTVIVGSAAAVIAYAIFFASADLPMTGSAIVFILLSAVVLIWAIRT